jgi:hypothetical protein
MNNKIKIVEIIADSNFGGGASHILGILENLNKDKFDLYLICPKGFLYNEARRIPGLGLFKIKMDSKFDIGATWEIKKLLQEIQ